MKTIYYLYISIVCFLLFFFLTIFIINGNQIFFDAPCYELLTTLQIPSFFKFITDFGDVYYLIIFVLLFLCISKKKNNGKFFISMMLLEVVSNIVLKNFFSRPRPTILWLIDETGFSFPSGHMMASTMFYGMCIYFLWETKQKKIWKIIGSILLTTLILLIGMSRIYLGVHYASDIIGGFLVSLCILSFGVFFYRSTKLNEKT